MVDAFNKAKWPTEASVSRREREQALELAELVGISDGEERLQRQSIYELMDSALAMLKYQRSYRSE